MTLTEQVYARALALAGELEEREAELLRLFSGAALSALVRRLKEGGESCREELVAAGSLYALAALMEADCGPRRFAAGELTVEKGEAAEAARRLRRQGDLLLAPFAREGFTFLGV